jgi:glycerol-3-phosphate dehydrogenase
VSLWGPTETRVDDIAEGYRVNLDDVDFLLEHAERELERPPKRGDIMSLRCGVRPLAVPASFHKDVYPLDISRYHRLVVDPERPWISFFGGKLTNCVDVATEIYAHLPRNDMAPPRVNGVSHGLNSDIEMEPFPGLDDPLPSASWSQRHEFCHTLPDYLRRRTNIAQWLPREGLGLNDENLPQLERIALTLCEGDRSAAAQQVYAYRTSVAERFDRLLSGN